MARYWEYDVMKDRNVKKTKTCESKEEAEEFLKQLNYRRENPIYIKNNGIPLYDLMLTNLDNKKNANLISQAQYDRVKRSLNVIKKAPFCFRNIEDIKSEEIQAFLNEMAKTYSNSSLKKFSEQFGQAFKYAFNKGYISKNPMIEVIRPKSVKKDKDVRAMTVDEESKFINYLLEHSVKDIPYRNAFLMQLLMGFRIGEVLALNSGDIDLSHHLINVNKTLTKLADGTIVMSDSPKTKAGNRILPIPKVLEPFIIEQLKISKDIPNNDEHLLSDSAIITSMNFFNEKVKDGEHLFVKFRYRQDDKGVTCYNLENGDVKLVFDEPYKAVTPGQACVFYKEDEECIGGGFIDHVYYKGDEIF